MNRQLRTAIINLESVVFGRPVNGQSRIITDFRYLEHYEIAARASEIKESLEKYLPKADGAVHLFELSIEKYVTLLGIIDFIYANPGKDIPVPNMPYQGIQEKMEYLLEWQKMLVNDFSEVP